MGKTLTRRDRRSLTCALAAKLQTPVQDCSRKTRRALSIATAAFRILALERPLGKGCSSARHARECTQLRNKIGLWAKGNDFAFSVRIDDLANCGHYLCFCPGAPGQRCWKGYWPEWCAKLHERSRAGITGAAAGQANMHQTCHKQAPKPFSYAGITCLSGRSGGLANSVRSAPVARNQSLSLSIVLVVRAGFCASARKHAPLHAPLWRSSETERETQKVISWTIVALMHYNVMHED
jgi:hypothetical protein